jgi:hypothetical protein
MSSEILKMAADNGKYVNGVWQFTPKELVSFVDDIINNYSAFETKILQDMFKERDEEILRLQRSVELLIAKRYS